MKLIFSFLLFIVCLLRPSISLAFDTSDPSVSLLQNRISNNFSRKYCKAVQNGFSKDEAMKSAIVKTENIISFSYNPQKKWIEKNDLADQISLQACISKKKIPDKKTKWIEKLNLFNENN